MVPTEEDTEYDIREICSTVDLQLFKNHFFIRYVPRAFISGWFLLIEDKMDLASQVSIVMLYQVWQVEWNGLWNGGTELCESFAYVLTIKPIVNNSSDGHP